MNGMYPLVMTNIAVEHGRNSGFSNRKWWNFHGYVSLPEGNFLIFLGNDQRNHPEMAWEIPSSPIFFGKWSGKSSQKSENGLRNSMIYCRYVPSMSPSYTSYVPGVPFVIHLVGQMISHHLLDIWVDDSDLTAEIFRLENNCELPRMVLRIGVTIPTWPIPIQVDDSFTVISQNHISFTFDPDGGIMGYENRWNEINGRWTIGIYTASPL